MALHLELSAFRVLPETFALSAIIVISLADDFTVCAVRFPVTKWQIVFVSAFIFDLPTLVINLPEVFTNSSIVETFRSQFPIGVPVAPVPIVQLAVNFAF